MISTNQLTHLSLQSTKGASIIRRFLTMIFEDELQFQIDNRTYKSAIAMLNQLQSNAETVLKKRKHYDPANNIVEVVTALNTLGITLDDCDKLNVIHIAGTKGKGSTAILTESILRHQGYKTGLFTSPHLMHVTERIQVNGIPISNDEFAELFWQMYSKLILLPCHHNIQLPNYFKYLTLMATQYFLDQHIDVGIFEVGIGGRYDSTNFFPNPWVTAVTTLDYDHIQILGKTIEEIAYNKGGIYKPGAVALTCSQQEKSALLVLDQCARDAKVTLQIAPECIDFIHGNHQKLNAALAVHIANAWIQRNLFATTNYFNKMRNLPSINLERKIISAIKNCHFAGRCQLIENVAGKNLHFFCDGAHTIKSINVAAKWFTETSSLKEQSKKVLIFTCTGERDFEPLLKILNNTCHFDRVIFTSRAIDRITDIHDDNTSMTSNELAEYQRSLEQANIWRRLNKDCECEIYNCSRDAFTRILKLAENDSQSYCVLITGSLHLVGAFLTILEEHKS